MALATVRSSSCSWLACGGGSRSSLSGFPSASLGGSLRGRDLSLECSSSGRAASNRMPVVTVRSAYGSSSSMSSWQNRFRALRSSSTESAVSSVPVQVAHDLLKAGHHYLDVRTPEEFAAGHVEGAVNIPFMYKFGTGMITNLDFVPEVSARFNKDDEIVVGCQSGRRSMAAATELLASGFTGVTDMGGGYGAWIQSNLPVRK
ncbi:thiosulfate sulfurtransferase 16, chloroplastic [Selaginella moellendorffii]|nr:thiosulfate sulfurtransferase 16, chloroplastic [Selaginella moellendorffii]|eukprot:XP_002969639.2 thiosulfate sulfurtransferase 16, chloroplastic [Selaginella moellendorffii]